ncbi:hypothetical protein, partial [Streptomyces sp. M2CJ-2]|uniref:hypothetical protein n=1 Tax=Streptomyces sp. M2CJ-2 TaxID=2803948 RepID=UPI001F3EE914
MPSRCCAVPLFGRPRNGRRGGPEEWFLDGRPEQSVPHAEGCHTPDETSVFSGVPPAAAIALLRRT